MFPLPSRSWLPLLLGCALSGFAAASARAELSFDEKILQLRSSPSEHSAAGVFRFENTGSEPVTIRKVHTTCGCTTAKLAKMTYRPGERGELATVFKYGFARGPLRKLLSVETEDGTTIPLEIHVRVEAPVTATPTLVFWRTSEAAKPKTVTIEVQPGVPAEVGPAECDSDDFQVGLAKSETGYLLTVTPRDTTQRAKARIRLPTRPAGAEPGSLTIYARVQ